jgi:glycosyltransferase involved in cell wall biosynthesis
MVAYNSPRKNSSGRVPPSLFRKFFVVLNFVILSFLWDGGADVYCRVTAKLLRGEDVKDGNDINEFLEKSTGKLNEQGHGVLHDEDDVHDHLHPTKHHGDRVGPGHHFDHPHNTRHKTPPTHHLEEHTHEVVHKPHPKKKDHFVQSYAAGPPPSDFWTGGTGKKVPSLDDLAPDPEELKNRPLLSLVMIVHNEAQSIGGIVDSCKGHVDRYTIIDTGSTDGTPDIIKERFGDTPGQVVSEPFVDFATTRNRAIELEGTQSVFAMMLSGDEYLREGAALRKYLEAHRSWDWTAKEHHEAYNMRILYSTDVYDSTRIHRTDARWFYVGVTHEYMTNHRKNVAIRRIDYEGTIPAVFHDLSTSNHAHKLIRWGKDRDLLKQEWERNPNRTRTAFYLAQSYECLGDFENAFKWYGTRWDLKGWNEEAYEARFRMARCSRHLGYSWAETQNMYLSAHGYLPARVEPLYAIGHYYYHEAKPRNNHLAFIFLQRGFQIPFPTNLRLFLDKPKWDYHIPDLLGITAYWIGEYKIGIEAVKKALRYKPGDKRLEKNLRFFKEKLAMRL